jgi:hypothetical protein
MATKAVEPSFHQRARIFGHVQQHAAGVPYRKGVQTGRAARDRYGHIQAQPAFATLRQAADGAHAGMDPERLDEPAVSGIEFFQLGGAHHGQGFSLAGDHPSTTWPSGDCSMAASMT